MRAAGRTLGLALVVMLGTGIVGSAPASGAVSFEVESVPPGAPAFVMAADDPAAQGCLAQAGYRLQLIDVTDPAFSAEFAGALEVGLMVSLWQRTDPAIFADPAQAAAAGRQLVTAAESVGYAAGGTVFLDLSDAAPGADPPTIQDWVDSWAAAVDEAGYVAGLKVGTNAGLDGPQLAAVLPRIFWQSDAAETPAISIGYSIAPAGPAGTPECGTPIDRYEVQSNENGFTLTAVRRGLGAPDPDPTTTVSESDQVVTGETLTSGEPTSSAPATETVTASSEPTTTATHQTSVSTSRPEPTLSNTGAPIGPASWIGVALLIIGGAFAVGTRRRRTGHAPHR